MDDAAVAAAEQARFDVSTSARRAAEPAWLRALEADRGPEGRPESPALALYAALPIALGVVGVSIAIRMQRDPLPTKVIVTPLFGARRSDRRRAAFGHYGPSCATCRRGTSHRGAR